MSLLDKLVACVTLESIEGACFAIWWTPASLIIEQRSVLLPVLGTH